MWFIGVEVEQETSAPPPKKNPGSAPDPGTFCTLMTLAHIFFLSENHSKNQLKRSEVTLFSFRLNCYRRTSSTCFRFIVNTEIQIVPQQSTIS